MSGTAMKTLLIDNYDSFTYNLFQLLAEVGGTAPTVVRNDAASWDELAREGFDNVVVSPGPGRPDDADDFGLCAEAILRCELPLLGVCLGHQGICSVHGARVERAPEAVHGRLGAVSHRGGPLFAGIPSPFRAVRYHSLCVDPDTLPAELDPLAWADDGVLMAVAHRRRPLWGVQFHPESIATEHGRRLLANFRDLSARWWADSGRAAARAEAPAGAAWGSTATRVEAPAGAAWGSTATRVEAPAGAAAGGGAAGRETGEGDRARADGEWRLLVERIAGPHDTEAAFVTLYGDSETAFWLDSARAGDGARFSFMGDDGGPHAAVVTYDVGAPVAVARRDGGVETHAETIFEYLAREQARWGELVEDELPFEFAGGFAGYLGYELKADCGGDRAHESPLPDAALVFADRLLAFDHEAGDAYAVCIADAASAAAGERWIADTARTLAAATPARDGDATATTGDASDAPAATTGGAFATTARDAPAATTGACAARPVDFVLARSPERYLDDIATCRERLLDGESYEVCLTNRIETDLDADPLALYRRLRRVNPAPFGAYLRFGGMAVLSSSPERFLRVGRDGRAEAKPIKGTAPRGATPAEDARLAAALHASEKDRAENLMIADLLRNDLGSVCAVGSVEVPRLMEIESYATVHQLVSTVRGRLRPGVAAADCVRACFPPGSMTGAPKRRTMEILDELEGAPRGVYSGAIGSFPLGGGCDLSVTIRTVVLAGGRATIGVGGAIVVQSDPEDELRETLLKGEAPMRAIDPRAAEAAVARALDSSGCQLPIPKP